MSAELPQALADYFAAKNGRDIDAMLAPFADDALVHDEGRDMHGLAAIRDWMEMTTRKYGVTVKVEELSGDGSELTVAALVSGNFPGSPARLHYHFKLKDGKIARLGIGA